MNTQKLLPLTISLLLGIVFAAGCAAPSAVPPFPDAPTAAATSTPFQTTRIDLDDELYIRQIRQNVFVVTHSFPWPANALIVEMANSELVIVGSTYTPEAMRQVLAWVEERFGPRNISAINTGFHVDNLGGNSALIEQNIPVYGPDLTAQLLEERGEQTRQVVLGMLPGAKNEGYYNAHAEIRFAPPTNLFPIAEGLQLSFGEEQVQVYYPGPSQASDKVVVYFPNAKVLFGGCMVLGGEQIGNTSDADLENWPEAAQKLKQFEVEVVVPGHGERLDAGLIEHTIALLTARP
ncbi:MAG: MBL fold metallo-hydrolase [Anaerolineae bacterium]|nr:MBL fold metallo-hydrolase [Anaerolineae bacterium]